MNAGHNEIFQNFCITNKYWIRRKQKVENGGFEGFSIFKWRKLRFSTDFLFYVISLPGFCVKAHTLIDNEKYFVNICQSDGIPSPEDISVEQLTEILSSETPNTYKIPMSITELRKTNDKSGKEATACDVAINPQFYKKINASIVFRDFFIAIIFEAFDSKYNIQINRDTWIILKNRKCIGTLVKHLVQNRDVKQVYQSYQNPPKSLIEDLDNSFEPKRKAKSRSLIQEIKKDATTVAAATNNARIVNIKQHCPEYRLYFRSAPFSHIVGEFFMPEIPSQSEINLNIAKNQILLQSRNGSYSLNKFLEYDVEPTKCDAQFNKQTHVSLNFNDMWIFFNCPYFQFRCCELTCRFVAIESGMHEILSHHTSNIWEFPGSNSSSLFVFEFVVDHWFEAHLIMCIFQIVQQLLAINLCTI